jgi:hypothetical protein
MKLDKVQAVRRWLTTVLQLIGKYYLECFRTPRIMWNVGLLLVASAGSLP